MKGLQTAFWLAAFAMVGPAWASAQPTISLTPTDYQHPGGVNPSGQVTLSVTINSSASYTLQSLVIGCSNAPITFAGNSNFNNPATVYQFAPETSLSSGVSVWIGTMD